MAEKPKKIRITLDYLLGRWVQPLAIILMFFSFIMLLDIAFNNGTESLALSDLFFETKAKLAYYEVEHNIEDKEDLDKQHIRNLNSIEGKDRRKLLLLLMLVGVVYLFFYNRKRPFRYMSCPYCDKSIQIIENWQCDKCYQFQGEDRYINKSCIHCGRQLDSVFCEHCHEEVLL